MEAPRSIPPLRSPDERERLDVSASQYESLLAGMKISINESNTVRQKGDRFYVREPKGSALPVLVDEVTEEREGDVRYFKVDIQYEPFPDDL